MTGCTIVPGHQKKIDHFENKKNKSKMTGCTMVTGHQIKSPKIATRLCSKRFRVLLQLIVLASEKKMSKMLPTLKLKGLLAPENPNLQKFVNLKKMYMPI